MMLQISSFYILNLNLLSWPWKLRSPKFWKETCFGCSKLKTLILTGVSLWCASLFRKILIEQIAGSIHFYNVRRRRIEDLCTVDPRFLMTGRPAIPQKAVSITLSLGKFHFQNIDTCLPTFPTCRNTRSFENMPYALCIPSRHIVRFCFPFDKERSRS